MNMIEPTNIAFRSCTENVFLPFVKVWVNVKYKVRISNEKSYVVPDGY